MRPLEVLRRCRTDVIAVHAIEKELGMVTVFRVRLAMAIVLFLLLLSVGIAEAEGLSDTTLEAVVPEAVGGLAGGELDGHWVVWAQDQAPDDPLVDERDVYAMNLDTNAIVVVASGPDDQGAVISLDGGVVIWTETPCATCLVRRIRGMDLDDGRMFVVAEIAHPSDIGRPTIAGRWVVWSERADGGDVVSNEHILYARDIETLSQPMAIASGEELSIGGSRTPKPFGHYDVTLDWVVWLAPVHPGDAPSQLMAHHLVTHETKLLTQSFPWAFDASGANVVAFQAAASTGGTTDAVVVVHIPSGEFATVFAGQTGASGSSIETDGNIVVWELPSGNTAGLVRHMQQAFALPVPWSRVELDEGFVHWFVPRARVGPTEIHTTWFDRLLWGTHSRYFPETEQWMALTFLFYWHANGGLEVFGYPLSEQVMVWDSGNVPMGVQWLERQRFEWHPEHVGTPYEVLLGRLGAELLEQQGRDWKTFDTGDPAAPHYIDETGHVIATEFWSHWSSRGLDLGNEGVSFRESLALFGYPISEPTMETNADGDTVLTQYFERAVFEYHPDNPVPHRVLLRRLGAEMLATRGW